MLRQSNVLKLRAARAVRLFFFIHPIRSLFYGASVAVVVAKTPSFLFAETSILKIGTCVTLGELIQAIGNAFYVIHSYCLSHLNWNFQGKGEPRLQNLCHDLWRKREQGWGRDPLVRENKKWTGAISVGIYYTDKVFFFSPKLSVTLK